MPLSSPGLRGPPLDIRRLGAGGAADIGAADAPAAWLCLRAPVAGPATARDPGIGGKYWADDAGSATGLPMGDKGRPGDLAGGDVGDKEGSDAEDVGFRSIMAK
jgi:hypothetical protein